MSISIAALGRERPRVRGAAMAELERLGQQFPPGVKYAAGPTEVVSESIRDVIFTLGLAIGLVILVIFCSDWRTT